MPSKAELPVSKIWIKEEPDHPQSSTNKQPKTENSLSAAKGKVKIENESSSISTCGICLSEEGKSIRGYIDSCGHYFCFICIVEWANIETRCPLCKRSFSSISPQIKDGAFTTQQIVSVPVRNQVYRHFENVTTGNQDSYAEIQCNVCHNNSNESLLMLCDLCDSASHTYCVGLGDTVPEDDWICRDCNILMYQHAEDDKDLNGDGLSAIDSSSGNQSRRQNHQNVPSAEAPVSIVDIVRESRSYDVVRSSSNRSRSPSTHVGDDGIIIAAANVEHNPQAESYVGHSGRQFAARTMQCCRTVDSQIRALRENWDKIREGSSSFSSFLISKPGLGKVSCGTSSKMNLSSCSNQQSHPKSSSSNIIPNPATEDIKKAWKMMNAAMSVEKRKCTNNVSSSCNGSKRPLSDTRTLKKSDMPLSSHDHNGDKGQDCNKLKKRYEDCGAEKRNDKRKYDELFHKVKPCTVLSHDGHPAIYSTESSKLSASEKVQHSVKDRIYQKSCVKLPPNNTLETFRNNSSKNHEYSYAFRSAAGPEDHHYAAKQSVHVSSSCNGKEAVINVEKQHAGGMAKTESDAKSEIQSLVKLNLKLLSRHKKLDTNAFKEVARLATHSILAACGKGAPKPWVRPFSSPICSHADKFEHVKRSILMPTCCRECFYGFVKDVVNTIMVENAS